VLLALRREHRFEASDVEAIEIATFRDSISVSDHPEIRSRLDAILSHQYNAALALIDGKIMLESFDEEKRSDATLLALAKRVSVLFDPQFQEMYPAKWPHRVSVSLSDGRRFEAQSDHPPGGVDSPLGWEQVVEKFMTLAVSRLGEAAAERVVAIVPTLDERADFAEFAGVLRGFAAAE
jgi:2-methylcitrate dehydratase PrpD